MIIFCVYALKLFFLDYSFFSKKELHFRHRLCYNAVKGSLSLFNDCFEKANYIKVILEVQNGLA